MELKAACCLKSCVVDNVTPRHTDGPSQGYRDGSFERMEPDFFDPCESEERPVPGRMIFSYSNANLTHPVSPVLHASEKRQTDGASKGPTR